jgi:hypothetical protein
MEISTQIGLVLTPPWLVNSFVTKNANTMGAVKAIYAWTKPQLTHMPKSHRGEDNGAVPRHKQQNAMKPRGGLASMVKHTTSKTVRSLFVNQ